MFYEYSIKPPLLNPVLEIKSIDPEEPNSFERSRAPALSESIDLAEDNDLDSSQLYDQKFGDLKGISVELSLSIHKFTSYSN